MDKRIYIRVPEQLLKDFDKACEANYTNKSEVLRRAMLDYVRENEGGSKMKNETYYLVQMAKGTDSGYDETSQPRTLLKTTDKKAALDFYETLPEWVALEETETDLEGREKYESPVVVEVSSDTRTMIRG